MTEEKKRMFMGRELPPLDKSKWTGTYKPAVPASPEEIRAFAKAVRAEPDLWEIFLRVKPDEWIPEEDSVRVSLFAVEYEKRTGTRIPPGSVGDAKQLLRALAEGRISEL